MLKEEKLKQEISDFCKKRDIVNMQRTAGVVKKNTIAYTDRGF